MTKPGVPLFTFTHLKEVSNFYMLEYLQCIQIFYLAMFLIHFLTLIIHQKPIPSKLFSWCMLCLLLGMYMHATPADERYSVPS